jgi:hypothetical protein
MDKYSDWGDPDLIEGMSTYEVENKRWEEENERQRKQLRNEASSEVLAVRIENGIQQIANKDTTPERKQWLEDSQAKDVQELWRRKIHCENYTSALHRIATFLEEKKHRASDGEEEDDDEDDNDEEYTQTPTPYRVESQHSKPASKGPAQEYREKREEYNQRKQHYTYKKKSPGGKQAPAKEYREKREEYKQRKSYHNRNKPKANDDDTSNSD